MSKPFRFRDRLRSFRHAFAGVAILLRTQHNAWIHAAATIGVIAAGFFFRLTAVEWCWIVAAIALVWVAEALNTALELLADAVSPEIHPVVGRAKDVAAGAVLIAAIAAAVIGAIVFWPYIQMWAAG